MVIFTYLTFAAYGQTDKGKLLIGGGSTLDFSSLNSTWKTDDDEGDAGKMTELEFSPQIGYFVIDNLAVGVELPITYSSETDEDDYKYSTTAIALAPFVRYYFGTTNIKPYLHGSAGYGTMKMKEDPPGGASDDEFVGMFIYSLGGGLGIFLNEKVSLDIGLGYVSASAKPEEDYDVNFRVIGSGFGIGIGFAIVL